LLPASRPLRLLIGAIVAAVVIIALVAPVVIDGSTTPSAPCAKTLRFRGHLYSARAMPTPRLVESLAIGIGVLTGCGAAPSNIDVRSLTEVDASVAIGIPSDASSVYIRTGVCTASAGHALWVCLRSR
jgi:hypothetical protein